MMTRAADHPAGRTREAHASPGHRILAWLLLASGVASVALLLTALAVNARSVRAFRDVNLSGSLRFRSLWLYGATHGGGQDWHPQAAAMGGILAHLRLQYPREVDATGPAWGALTASLAHTGQADWATANAMREAPNTLTRRIETRAAAQENALSRLLWLGLAGLAATVGTSLGMVRRLRRAEEAQRAEREFTHAMLESLHEGIVACDAQGTLTLFNRATREFHGLPERPLPPEEWAEHYDLYEADGVMPMRTEDIPLLRALQGEAVRDAEMVIAPKGGPARTVLCNGRAILDATGTKLGAVAAMHDVTARQGMERELSRLAAIVESSEEAIIAGTLDGTIVSWNRGAERLYGYTASEMVGQHSSVLAQEHERRLGPGIVARLVRGEAVEPMDTVRTRRDGSSVDVSLSFSPIRDAGGMVGVSCVSRDITDRKRAEAALRESNAALQESQLFARSVAENSASIIFVFDLDARSNVYSNRDVAEFLGYTPERVAALGADLLPTMIHPDDLPRLMAHFEGFGAVADGEVVEFEYRARHSSGQWRWVWNREVVFKRHGDGRPWQILGNAQDVTERRRQEEALREAAERMRQSEAALRAVLDGAPVVLYAADINGQVTLSEGTGLAALGLRPGEAVGRSVFEFGGDAEVERNTRRALGGEAVSYDARYEGLCLHTELRPVRDGAGTVTGIIGVCSDVTERVLSEERFRVLFDHSSDAHLLLGEGGVIDCNEAAIRMLRCADKAQVLSLHPAVLSPEFQPDGRTSLEKSVEMDALAHGRGFHRFEWTHRKMDGEEFPVEVTLTPVALAGRPVLLVVWHDLTERKRAEDQIRDHAVILEFQKQALEKANAELATLATTDGLTGLKNHRAFQERLAEEVRRSGRYGPPLSLVLLDVDHFKQYNDAFGHPAGDAVLRAVAHILQDAARDTDIVARYGGEEFALLLPQTDLGGAAALAERLRAAAEERPWPLRRVTAWFGVASLRPGEGGAELIARVDAALYRSKTGGRNRVMYGTVPVMPPTQIDAPSEAFLTSL